MVAIAGGIVLAVVLLVVLPFVVLAVKDWRWWRCWLLNHKWRDVGPFTHSTGLVSRQAYLRCARCDVVPGAFEEIELRKKLAHRRPRRAVR